MKSGNIETQAGSVISKPRLTNNQKMTIIVIGLVLLMVYAIVYYIFSDAIETSASVSAPETVQNVFVDINGDGLVDLLQTGKVIFNEGQPNFPQGQ